ncbi:hypothetical protein ACFFIX_20135 [Metabacillus herbersteinensis]|uniref:Lipoprotein n=1 Tax=Metabacillus herbersteinensis TaxID=283816 RepID=A0ABV6GLA1_9BACI
MKKIMMSFAFISVFIFLLVGCTTEGKGELTRMDMFIENQGDTHIQDKDTLDLLENLSEQVKWEPNKVPSMAREAEVKAIFFYEVEKNMPERLYEYEIWFNEDAGTATIISNDEKEGYGELDKDNAKALKNILFK